MHPLGGVRRPDRDAVAGLDTRRDQRAGRGDGGARRAAANVIRSRSSTSASSDANSRCGPLDDRRDGSGARPSCRRHRVAYDIRERGAWAWPTTGHITDEGIARLRARIGVPEPHPLPPHYTLPTHRHVPQRRGGVRRRQSAVVRSRLRREDPLGGRDRAAAARRRRHARRRGRGRPRSRPSSAT